MYLYDNLWERNGDGEESRRIEVVDRWDVVFSGLEPGRQRHPPSRSFEERFARIKSFLRPKNIESRCSLNNNIHYSHKYGSTLK